MGRKSGAKLSGTARKLLNAKAAKKGEEEQNEEKKYSARSSLRPSRPFLCDLCV
jgi:hypothetical protein